MISNWFKMSLKMISKSKTASRALSQWSQKKLLIAGLEPVKGPKFGSKRLPARIWPKTAVSQWSQKALLIAGEEAAEWPKFGSKIASKGDFPGKVFQKVISKWFWKWFQNDFNCKNGAKLLPEEIFREKSSKKWFQIDLKDFESDFKLIFNCKNGAKNASTANLPGKVFPKSDVKVILKMVSTWF